VTLARATDSSPNLNMIFIIINGDIWSFLPGSWWLLSSKFSFIMITNYRNPGLFWRYKTISMIRSWEVLVRLSLEMWWSFVEMWRLESLPLDNIRSEKVKSHFEIRDFNDTVFLVSQYILDRMIKRWSMQRLFLSEERIIWWIWRYLMKSTASDLIVPKCIQFTQIIRF